MEITEVRVRLIQDDDKEKLRAFATITFDNCFVVREVKVIQGDKGYFVAMPSRKAMERCRNCGVRNVVKAVYCSRCGQRLPQRPATPIPANREKIYLDIAHPINAECRKKIHDAVIGVYQEERRKFDEIKPQGQAQKAGSPTESEEAAEFDEDGVNPEVEKSEGKAGGEEEDDFDKGIFA
ncbi:MAG: septation protein SpoVG family protein [Planctomycetes bacterium]|nr:septation protein SpoVG family protein [Planctomycetota bacterium]